MYSQGVAVNLFILKQCGYYDIILKQGSDDAGRI